MAKFCLTYQGKIFGQILPILAKNWRNFGKNWRNFAKNWRNFAKNWRNFGKNLIYVLKPNFAIFCKNRQNLPKNPGSMSYTYPTNYAIMSICAWEMLIKKHFWWIPIFNLKSLWSIFVHKMNNFVHKKVEVIVSDWTFLSGRNNKK